MTRLVRVLAMVAVPAPGTGSGMDAPRDVRPWLVVILNADRHRIAAAHAQHDPGTTAGFP